MMDTGIFDALEEEDLLLIAAVLHQKNPPTNQNKKGARNLEKTREIWVISPASPGAKTEWNQVLKLFSCVTNRLWVLGQRLVLVFRISNPVSGGQCHLIHLTILRMFTWPSLAYMCTKVG